MEPRMYKVIFIWWLVTITTCFLHQSYGFRSLGGSDRGSGNNGRGNGNNGRPSGSDTPSASSTPIPTGNSDPSGTNAENTGNTWWRHGMITFSALLALRENVQWCGALMCSLMLTWTSCWTNSGYAGDSRHQDTNFAVSDSSYPSLDHWYGTGLIFWIKPHRIINYCI